MIRARLHAVRFPPLDVLVWYSEVFEIDKHGNRRVLVTDNCTDFDKFMQEAREDVWAFRRVESLEQLNKSRSWNRILTDDDSNGSKLKKNVKTMTKKELRKLALSARGV